MGEDKTLFLTVTVSPRGLVDGPRGARGGGCPLSLLLRWGQPRAAPRHSPVRGPPSGPAARPAPLCGGSTPLAAAPPQRAPPGPPPSPPAPLRSRRRPLPGEHVGVVGLAEGALQLLQLEGAERGAVPPLFSLRRTRRLTGGRTLPPPRRQRFLRGGARSAGPRRRRCRALLA